MKKYYLFIALAMVAAMTVSCKNNKKAEAEAEVVEAAKTILADDVLARIDEIGKPFLENSGEYSFASIISSNLTEEEKLVKPDYLLDPAVVNTLTTKNQKIFALGILVTESKIREIYEMPVEEAKEAIGRLYAEIGTSLSIDDPDNKTISEKLSEIYNKCKENGELSLFWQLQFAVQCEFNYLISQNPDIYFRNISEEQFQSFGEEFLNCRKVVETLAEYDPEVKLAWDAYCKFRTNYPDENARQEAYKTIEAAKETFASKKEDIAARRAEILK